LKPDHAKLKRAWPSRAAFADGGGGTLFQWLPDAVLAKPYAAVVSVRPGRVRWSQEIGQ
jgi:hypothetical protein